jgi:hypothetical protein
MCWSSVIELRSATIRTVHGVWAPLLGKLAADCRRRRHPLERAIGGQSLGGRLLHGKSMLLSSTPTSIIPPPVI